MALYDRSEAERQLEEVCFVDGKQYCVNADSGYNRRNVVVAPFAGSALSAGRLAANREAVEMTVTIEWWC